MNFFKRILNLFVAEDATPAVYTPTLSTVFVYGTLRKGFGNHRLLENPGVRYLGKDYLTGFRMVSCGGFPAIFPVGPVQSDSDDIIMGELYEVDDDTMYNLDRLEGVPFHYQRVKATTVNGTDAWVYVQDEGGSRTPVPSGDWMTTRTGRWNFFSPVVEG
jgi:gamma-glutamylcyclotransferase (GGCT)/AIG2-like uncharacterized protein YtfP